MSLFRIARSLSAPAANRNDAGGALVKPDAPIAVIDIGSNSIRLVVFQGAQRFPVPIFNEKVFCGLARGLTGTGHLDPENVNIALQNLERFTKLASVMGVGKVEMLATAAVRDARDGADFARRAEQLCGIPIRVLDGTEEALLSAEGVIAGSPLADGIMGDLGGGSLELVRLVEGVPREKATLPLGGLRLLGEVGRDARAARRRIDEALESLPWLQEAAGQSFFAVGGSWRALARISIDSRAYPLRVIHGYVLPPADLDDLARVVSRQTKDSLAHMKTVSARRLETLPLSALVLRRLLRRLGPGEVVFSAFGLREGWLFNQLPLEEREKDPLMEVARDVNRRDARFGQLGAALFAWSAPLFRSETPEQSRLREAVCHFSDLGWREHPDYRASWSMHRILKWPFLAADHRERAFIAQAVAWRYGGTGEMADYRALLEPELVDRAKILGLALRLAYTLSAGTPEVLQLSALYLSKGRPRLHLPPDSPVPSGKMVERRLEQLAEAVANAG